MAGKPGSREEHEAAQRWAKDNVRSSMASYDRLEFMGRQYEPVDPGNEEHF